ncbi:DUF2846 domain-containing protein [Neisseria sp. ZJ106]|uniref:DUF2846 domain-containing protein n=1 Tax=Neisseria lisongii TaxID=2912188 RepID=A0ABY7RJ05_9NEIS|nr:DUF2846 domain-containing protein [Neisseria lisongii]MCF7521978.1 DUF2846 domain-containing protein [Neisseria lisongii]WCL71352.1 DUF2846 domain-containing protein [Neisseria lisongii]
MKKLFAVLFMAVPLFLTGCVSTTMDSLENDAAAKKFEQPKNKMSGIYIYRDSIFGSALKKNLYIDDHFIGESAPKVYFYKQVKAGPHKISTESEFSNNDLNINTESGKNYFIRQYIKLGVFIGGANLEQVSEEQGKKAVSELKRALAQ